MQYVSATHDSSKSASKHGFLIEADHASDELSVIKDRLIWQEAIGSANNKL